MRVSELDQDSTLLDAVISQRGVNWSADRCVEDCASLIVALHKYASGDASMQDIAQRMADVQIALALLTRFVSATSFNQSLGLRLRVIRDELQRAEQLQQMQMELNDGD